jgi:hypothetical protein
VTIAKVTHIPYTIFRVIKPLLEEKKLSEVAMSDRALQPDRYAYMWEVIYDPTNFFIHRCFRLLDLTLSAGDGVWAEGTKFRNMDSHIVLELRKKHLILSA